jgi:DNA (cytosine-5)-methyltransferase 1
MKILNLYAGIGGNRKLWGDEHDITAVEFEKQIADKYCELYPNDKMIVADAHEYLLNNYKQFDFVWSSPPCQSHSRTNYFLNAQGTVRYPDMKLYQEIILLQSFCKGLFCVENVIGYYEPLIKPIEIGRHYLWANFNIPKIEQDNKQIGRFNGKRGVDRATRDKDITERNAVNSELGLHILNCALGKKVIKKEYEQESLFGEQM